MLLWFNLKWENIIIRRSNAKTSPQTGCFRLVSDNYDKAGTSDGVKKELDEKLLARNISNYKNEGGRKNPTTMNGWNIEDEDCLFYNNAGTKTLFLLHDSGIDDPQRIMVFGLEKALDGLVQIVKWAIRGSVKKLTALFKPTSLMPL